MFTKDDIFSEKLKKTLITLTMKEDELLEGFTEIPIEQIEDTINRNIIDTSPEALPGTKHFAPVLEELDKLKNKLGGSPNFGSETPTIDNKDSKRLFLGIIPLSAIKDWFRMTLDKGWRPHFFWKSVARLFGVKSDNKMSLYEEAHTRIQRFGLLIANKERFIKILEDKDTKRYGELCSLTGLAWHPTQNGVGTEKMYIEFIEKFLTEYFEKAKQEGPEALKEYFEALSSGVCFEDRARRLEEYAKLHPFTPGEKVEDIPDYDTRTPIEEVYNKELMVVGAKAMGEGRTLTVNELFVHLTKKGIFDTEFATSDGGRAKPTEESYRKWAQKQVDEHYTLEEDEPFPPKSNM